MVTSTDDDEIADRPGHRPTPSRRCRPWLRSAAERVPTLEAPPPRHQSSCRAAPPPANPRRSSQPGLPRRTGRRPHPPPGPGPSPGLRLPEGRPLPEPSGSIRRTVTTLFIRATAPESGLRLRPRIGDKGRRRHVGQTAPERVVGRCADDCRPGCGQQRGRVALIPQDRLQSRKLRGKGALPIRGTGQLPNRDQAQGPGPNIFPASDKRVSITANLASSADKASTAGATASLPAEGSPSGATPPPLRRAATAASTAAKRSSSPANASEPLAP